MGTLPLRVAAITSLPLCFGLACSGLFGSIDSGPPVADRCGHVTSVVTFPAAKADRYLITHADGAPIGRVLVPGGSSSAEVRTFLGANRTVALHHSLGRLQSEPLPATTPPWEVALARIGPLKGPAPQLEPVEVAVLAGCSVDGVLTLDAALSPGGAALGRGLAFEGGKATLAFPALPPGDYTVSLTLKRDPVVLEAQTFSVVVGPPCVDQDGDGVQACDGDCDDGNPHVHPGAAEVLGDGLDNDCDGVNGRDRDGDGYEAQSAGGDDCNDSNADVYPGRLSPPDADGDGAYVWTELDWNCDGQVTRAPGPFDCDDQDPARPQPELADPNGVDDDCDGITDEGTIAYDDDGDGYAEEKGDCNDADTSVFPGASERGDCKDNDCDGTIDEGVTRKQVDDVYEPNDAAPYALAGAVQKRGFLGNAGHKPTLAHLALTTRDANDVETFSVWTHDGVLDTWHVTADLRSMGDRRSYEVIISGPGAYTSGVVHAPGGQVRLEGRGLESNTGTYTIEIRARSGELDHCPLAVSISSG